MFEGITPDNPLKVVLSRQARQQVSDVQRDVYDSHRHRIFALAFYMTGNEIQAEEILTATFVSAFRENAIPRSEQVDSALVAELARRFPLGHAESLQDLNTASGPCFNLAGRNVRRTDLEEAIQTIPPTERFVFLLRDVEGYQPPAISRLLDIPEGKVQRTLFAARIRLRQALASQSTDQREAA